VTQCALSRICGVCGQSLGRPIAFVGTTDEVNRNAFHFPPLHVGCAMSLAGRTAATEVVTTSGFELIRPAGGETDRRLVFEPNSLL
jgi:hypothetical protein